MTNDVWSGPATGQLRVYSHLLARVPMVLILLSHVLQAGTSFLKIKLPKQTYLKRIYFSSVNAGLPPLHGPRLSFELNLHPLL